MAGPAEQLPPRTCDPTGRFSDRAADYVRFRPSYPPEAIDAIVDGLGDPASLSAADVGAGTGIMTRLLAARGVRTFAIEPNAAMREAGERLDPSNRARQGAARSVHAAAITWLAATAESTTLDDASVDLVVCAQSYHWFEPERACGEFGRILRPRGRLALIWNDGDESTPVARGYYDAVREASPDGPTVHKEPPKGPDVRPPFDPLCRRRFRYAQRLDADGLIGRAMSASYVPKDGPAALRLIERLHDLHAQHADSEGLVALEYDTWLWVGEKATFDSTGTPSARCSRTGA